MREADADDISFYSAMDPQERLDLVVELSRQVFGGLDELFTDFADSAR